MADEYVELPEELIQHVQSFLDWKQAARTSVLSKLWYSAWSTRPVLYLDEFSFPRIEFENLARRSIDRYQKLNVKLNTLELHMFWRTHDYDEFTRLGDELILSALTLGVNDLNLRFCEYTRMYVLSDQVFSSICLKKLYICGCIINLPPSNGKPRVLCSRLVSLELFHVRVSDDMMKDVLLGSPLMEDLRIINCYGLEKINLSAVRCNLRTFHADSLSWQKLLVEWDGVNVHHRFHKLISLKLCEVEVDDMFFKFFPHRFPCLGRLELEECIGPVTNIDIASNSLRYLSLKWIRGLRFITIQVPNIQNFRLVTSWNQGIPSLSFTTFSKEWSSDLGFSHSPGEDWDANVSWWLKIRDILTELSLSKISIAIKWLTDDQLGSYSKEIIQSNHVSPFVENLMIETRGRGKKSFGWLLCCRPKYITWTDNHGNNMNHSGLSPYRKNLLQLIYYELKKHENKNASYPLPCIHGLEEIDMENYDETLREWCPVRPLRSQLRIAHEEGKFRLRLKWTNKQRLTGGGFQECCHGIVYFINFAGTQVKVITSLCLPFLSEPDG